MRPVAAGVHLYRPHLRWRNPSPPAARRRVAIARLLMLRAVIFDFDFTLADASEGIIDCVSYALSALGLPAAEPAAIRQTIGLSLRATFEALTTPEQRCDQLADDFASNFLSRSEQVMVKKTVVYPGSCQAITSLRECGVATAIASSKFRRRISAVLELNDLSKLFDYVVGGEDVPEGEEKPHPTPLVLAAAGLVRRVVCPQLDSV